MDKTIVLGPDLATMSAQQLMTANVKSAYEGWSIKMLMDFFIRQGISGAPVTASDGELVGVVTLSDVMRFESMTTGEKEKMTLLSGYRDFIGHEYSDEELKKMMKNADTNCTVNQIMTHEVIQVDVTAPLVEVARVMQKKHIHRVFVSAERKVVGVISTSNVLNALIQYCDA